MAGGVVERDLGADGQLVWTAHVREPRSKTEIGRGVFAASDRDLVVVQLDERGKAAAQERKRQRLA